MMILYYLLSLSKHRHTFAQWNAVICDVTTVRMDSLSMCVYVCVCVYYRIINYPNGCRLKLIHEIPKLLRRFYPHKQFMYYMQDKSDGVTNHWNKSNPIREIWKWYWPTQTMCFNHNRCPYKSRIFHARRQSSLLHDKHVVGLYLSTSDGFQLFSVHEKPELWTVYFYWFGLFINIPVKCTHKIS